MGKRSWADNILNFYRKAKEGKLAMRVVVLDGTTKNNFIDETVTNIFTKKSTEVVRYKLKDMNILPCRSCGSCGYNTPGRCVLKDDMEKIVIDIVNSHILIFVTPIIFGGYSADLKKAVDRFMVLGLPFFTVKDGNLLHPMRYEEKFLVGIGLSEIYQPDQEAGFKDLVARNSINTQYPHRAVVFKSADSSEKIHHDLQDIFSEVC